MLKYIYFQARSVLLLSPVSQKIRLVKNSLHLLILRLGVALFRYFLIRRQKLFAGHFPPRLGHFSAFITGPRPFVNILFYKNLKVTFVFFFWCRYPTAQKKTENYDTVSGVKKNPFERNHRSFSSSFFRLVRKNRTFLYI